MLRFATLLFASMLVGGFPVLYGADVDLTLDPINQTVSTGDTVDVSLVATSAGPGSQDVVALDAILNWDPAKLALIEIVSGSGHAWFVSDFLLDPDGLNDDLTDGDALYTALTPPGAPAPAPTTGLLVATFRFQTLADTAGTVVSMLPMSGAFAQTQVLFLFAEDITGDISGTATIVSESPDPGFVRGDTNNDDTIDIADAIWLLNYLFQGGPAPACLDAGDTNDDTGIDIGDSVYLMNYQFISGPPPPSPFPGCGTDPTPDLLDCASYGHCI